LIIEHEEIDEEMKEHQSKEYPKNFVFFREYKDFIYPLIIEKSSSGENNLNKNSIEGIMKYRQVTLCVGIED
jgi:hypothetical protein